MNLRNWKQVSDDRSRVLLAAMYGEGISISTEELAALEATRDLLRDWSSGELNAPQASLAGTDSLVAALGAGLAIGTWAGEVSLRRGALDLSLSSANEAFLTPGALLTTGPGSSCELSVGDHGTVVLRGESVLRFSLDGEGNGVLTLLRGNLSLGGMLWPCSIEVPGAVVVHAANGVVQVVRPAAHAGIVCVTEGEATVSTADAGRLQVAAGYEVEVKDGALVDERSAAATSAVIPSSPLVRTRGWRTVGAFCMATFFTFVAVARIAEAATPLPPIPLASERYPQPGIGKEDEIKVVVPGAFHSILPPSGIPNAIP